MNHDSQNSGWVECPPNTIGKMLNAEDALKRQVMRRTLLIGGGVTITAVAAGILNVFQEDDKGSQHTPISCQEVNKRLADYVANRIDNQQLVMRIKTHLDKCSWCANQHKKLVG